MYLFSIMSIMKRFIVVSVAAFLVLGSCTEKTDGPDEPAVEPPVELNDGYELSYWVDMDMSGAHLRGYWYDVSVYDEEKIPENGWIENACQALSGNYGADKLYVIWHRQYEPETAKTVFRTWQEAGKSAGVKIVPTVVLQSYSSSSSMNFSDEEITAFAEWSVGNICDDEFAVYDVYTRDAVGSSQDHQLKLLKEAVGDILTRVGQQPGVALNDSYSKAVEDTWTAECQGKTNELWENPIFYKGHKNYGRLLLESWVKERVEGESRPFVWNMIPVAWDYDTDDELSYDCPGDNALTNDPPVPGRLELCHKYISACYPGGLDDKRFGGYSCDLHILQANSSGRGESPSFYEAIREAATYEGDFSAAMSEIGELFNSL